MVNEKKSTLFQPYFSPLFGSVILFSPFCPKRQRFGAYFWVGIKLFSLHVSFLEDCFRRINLLRLKSVN